VQTMEGTPAFVHGGPFANIAQGTNTAIATRLALKLTDYVVTEAGFATDLGAEKFFHIKCRTANLKPKSVVIVATVKAVQFHGGFTADGGLGNLAKHIENIKQFGLKPIVAINHFSDDKDEDIQQIVTFCNEMFVEAIVGRHYELGGKGALNLAEAVVRNIKQNESSSLKYLYPLEASLQEKIEILAKNLYGAKGVDFDQHAINDMDQLTQLGYGNLPICVAKTPMSLSDNPKLKGRPKDFNIVVNELRISAGAGFVVVICGNIMTMPGLPKVPAALKIKVFPDGRVSGLS
jgi:formate--tetrahydrofolate ligase